MYMYRRLSEVDEFVSCAYSIVIPYQTAKSKSGNIMSIWDPCAKFNSDQYLQL